MAGAGGGLRAAVSQAEPTSRISVPLEHPRPRLHPRALAGRLKRRLRSMAPAKIGSEEWLLRNGMLVVGAQTYGRPRVHVYAGDCARVSIGSWCSLANEIEIMPGGNHRTDTVTTFPLHRRLNLPADPSLPSIDTGAEGDVSIGNDVWIGRGVKILGGVTIGDGAVVAAWSTVTRSIPPYAIAAGIPARVVRYRFPEDVIESLERIRWWEWPEDRVIDRAAELASTDIESFIERYDPARKAAAGRAKPVADAR